MSQPAAIRTRDGRLIHVTTDREAELVELIAELLPRMRDHDYFCLTAAAQNGKLTVRLEEQHVRAVPRVLEVQTPR